MDFHQEFQKVLRAHPFLEALIFVDPDGESILFEARDFDTFFLKLAGAKAPIFMSHFVTVGLMRKPVFLEMQYEGRCVCSVTLEQGYSITAVCGRTHKRAMLRHLLDRLAEKFNREIV